MRSLLPSLLLLFFVSLALAQDKTDGPTDEKAKKSFAKGLEDLKTHNPLFALDEFKKADRQDGGHCRACQKEMIKYGVQLGEWKTAELGAEEMIADAKETKDVAISHYQFAVVLINEGKERHKQELFSRAHEEAVKALFTYSNFPDACYLDGTALAHLGQDDAARARFEEFVKAAPAGDPTRQRALRFINRPELVRAKMAPPFSVTTVDGLKISMDDLQGKVVLLDFWATWCGPCREALPHIRNVARKFKDEPLVILSVSLDTNEQQWKEFIGKNEMTWPQYRDGGFTGPVSKLFSVTAIPHTFTIDADGVLQEEHVGDASIEGKLKKLIARARELQAVQSSPK
jgi:thiol-disulfide isomerase/thioredoxin